MTRRICDGGRCRGAGVPGLRPVGGARAALGASPLLPPLLAQPVRIPHGDVASVRGARPGSASNDAQLRLLPAGQHAAAVWRVCGGMGRAFHSCSSPAGGAEGHQRLRHHGEDRRGGPAWVGRPHPCPARVGRLRPDRIRPHAAVGGARGNPSRAPGRPHRRPLAGVGRTVGRVRDGGSPWHARVPRPEAAVYAHVEYDLQLAQHFELQSGAGRGRGGQHAGQHEGGGGACGRRRDGQGQGG